MGKIKRALSPRPPDLSSCVTFSQCSFLLLLTLNNAADGKAQELFNRLGKNSKSKMTSKTMCEAKCGAE